MKCGVSILRGHLLLTLLLGVALAGPVQGAPITVFFDGPFVATGPGDPMEHKGISEARALASGVPILSIPTFTVADGMGGFNLEVLAQSADGTIIPPGMNAPNDITSDWVVQNNFGDFGADVYLLFATAQNAGGSSYNVDFTDEPCSAGDPNCVFPDAAGLTIDPDLGWRIIETQDAGNSFFYVGILLDDFMNAGQNCGGQTLIDTQTCVSVQYFLENPDAQLMPSGPNQILPLPELQILMAVVPEPGTGAMLGLGLAALAAIRRRRS